LAGGTDLKLTGRWEPAEACEVGCGAGEILRRHRDNWTAIATVTDAGYEVTAERYTPTHELWGPSWKGRLVHNVLPEHLAARRITGYSLPIKARPTAA
jgi:hypothetical protein